MRTTSSMKEQVARLAADRAFDGGPETAERLFAAGLVAWENEIVLTAAGKALALEIQRERATKRAARNARARGRHEALTSVGMVRVRGGGYE